MNKKTLKNQSYFAKIVMFGSGRGTTIASFCEAISRGSLPAKIVSIITDNENSGVLDVAKEYQIPLEIVPIFNKNEKPLPAPFEDIDDYRDAVVSGILGQLQPDWILLAGYLRKVGRRVLKKYEGKIINSHPSLLPDFSGKGMYGLKVHQSVIEKGVKETGVTIHFVNHEYDSGEIIAQQRIPVLRGDSPHSLENRVKSIEKILYIQTFNDLLKDKGFFKK